MSGRASPATPSISILKVRGSHSSSTGCGSGVAGARPPACVWLGKGLKGEHGFSICCRSWQAAWGPGDCGVVGQHLVSTGKVTSGLVCAGR